MPKKARNISLQRPFILIIPLVLILALAVTLYVLVIRPRLGRSHPPAYSAADIEAMNTGIRSLENGDYDSAIQSFTTVIGSQPRLGPAYNNRGLAHQAKGEFELAFADFQKAVQLMPEEPTPYNNRGSIYFTQGDFEKAIADFNQAIERDPQFAKAYYNRGAVFLSLGDNTGAIAEFDKAIEYTPVITATQAAPAQPAGSLLEFADSASQRYANLPLAYANRGSAYLGNAEYDKAFQDFNKAIALKPDLSMAYYYRGLAYYSLGEYVKAIPEFTTVISLNNDVELIEMAKARLTEIGQK